MKIKQTAEAINTEINRLEDVKEKAFNKANALPKGAEQNKSIAAYWEAKGSQETLKWVLGEST